WHPCDGGAFFVSNAANLSLDDTNGAFDVLRSDTTAYATRRVTHAWTNWNPSGDSSITAHALSADGRYLVYQGSSNGLQGAFLRDLVAGTTILASVNAQGTPASGGSSTPSISANGRYVVYESNAANLVPTDTNGATDVFRYDRQSGAVDLVSVGATGQ